MEILIAIIALLIAIWQLKLQRDEVIRNGKVSTLIHMANVIKDKIAVYEKIIEDKKARRENWKPLADKVNNELRPLLESLNKQIIDTTSSYHVLLSAGDIKELIAPGSRRQ